ncbi:MAG: hypothetical protein ABEL51_04240 [Salinibacter sp.]
MRVSRPVRSLLFVRSLVLLVGAVISHTPAAQKNYQSGGPPMEETVEDAQTATVKVHLSPDRRSALTLPVRSETGP